MGIGRIRTHERLRRSHPFEPAQSFAHNSFAQTSPLMSWDSSYWLKIRAASHIVEPDRAEGGHSTIGCNRNHVEVPSIKRGGLEVAVPLRVITIVPRDVDIIFMEGQARGIASFQELEAIPKWAHGITRWGRCIQDGIIQRAVAHILRVVTLGEAALD